jgi:hypothetical protein
MSIKQTLEREWAKKVKRNFDTFYVAVDLHDTIIKSNYDGIATDIFKEAIPCLSYLSSRSDIILILWTGTHPNEIDIYKDMLAPYGISFDFINENPLEKGDLLSNFNQKFYFNLLLDDKAGFDPHIDYQDVLDFFKNHL